MPVIYLHQLVDLLPRVCDERSLPSHALLDVGEDQEGGALLPGDEGLVADLRHQRLDLLHVGLALVHAAGHALRKEGTRSYRTAHHTQRTIIVHGDRRCAQRSLGD